MSGAALLRLELLPSRGLATLVIMLHLAAGGCLYAAIGGAPGMALAALASALGAAAAWDRALLRGRRSARAIELAADGRAQVELAGGQRCAAADGGRRVGRYWVTIPLRGHSRRTILVASDMLDAERFRLLRLWALWGRAPGVAPAQPLA